MDVDDLVRVGLHILCEKVNMRDERELRILCDATHEGFALPSFPATSGKIVFQRRN